MRLDVTDTSPSPTALAPFFRKLFNSSVTLIDWGLSIRNRSHILTLDDNENNRAIRAASLAAQGYSTAEACDGVEALEAVRDEAPDLILLDVSMPRMDGPEARQQLKADAELGFIPVILVTARVDAKIVVAGLDAGADEYLTKPLDQSWRRPVRLRSDQDNNFREEDQAGADGPNGLSHSLALVC